MRRSLRLGWRGWKAQVVSAHRRLQSVEGRLMSGNPSSVGQWVRFGRGAHRARVAASDRPVLMTTHSNAPDRYPRYHPPARGFRGKPAAHQHRRRRGGIADLSGPRRDDAISLPRDNLADVGRRRLRPYRAGYPGRRHSQPEPLPGFSSCRVVTIAEAPSAILGTAAVGKKKIGPPTGPRAKNTAETRERILLSAIEHFAQGGFNGAKTEAISRDADVGNRMIYHYFGDKEGLYVAALDHVLGGLRMEELKLDLSVTPPLDGLLTMFDFTSGHFERHPELVRLLSAENLMGAAYLRKSEATPMVASPVVGQIRDLLRRGEAEGSVRAGLDPLHVYVMMVALSYFHLSNAPTLSAIWNQDLTDSAWRAEHRRLSRDMLRTFLAPTAAQAAMNAADRG
ncbi:TetR family transcriptional regulator [Pseudooceanicola sp. 216_PA32_1]|uniref:TetR family transcriptional regulator n=1 Tax=Pseudooceanicola pacificus TaxID=2676438 RepID=A0A844WCC8_9RHOB|nr:TetR family transcriptional regulator [Pseudooceanicola pacificus]